MNGERVYAFRVNMINSDVLRQLKQLEKENYISMINIGNYEDINEDAVYVIYQDGEQYDNCGMKGVYRQIGTARALVTRKSKEAAYCGYAGDWLALDKHSKTKMIDQQRKRFQIKEFTEKIKLQTGC